MGRKVRTAAGGHSFSAASRNVSLLMKTSGGLVSLWQLASHLLAFYF